MNKKMTISLVSGLTLSAIALYLAFKNVPVHELIDYLASINYFWIIPAVLVSLSSFALRAIRWQLILETAQKVSFWEAFHPMMIGFMLNCILPARVGEMARPGILQKRDALPFSTGLATVAAERLFDIIMLVVLFTVLLSTVQIDPALDITFGNHHLNGKTLETVGRGMLNVCGILIFGIISVSFDKTRKFITTAIMGIPSILFFVGPESKKNISRWISIHPVGIIENFADGFALVKNPKKIYICICLSLLIWSLQAFSFYIMSFGCPGINLSFLEIAAVMIILSFFIALPSAPGFWGLWEAGGVFALSLFGVFLKDAAGFTLANHAIQIFPVIIIGLISAVITGINIWQVSYNNS
ncbi:MAG: flippase-like domain-containing protein [Deltaproteobacteria bacterium]|nr:flippase-like domain-containing protein [Deltaproteobacteria bacterium]